MLKLALQPPDPGLNIRPVQLTDVITLHAQCWQDRPQISIYQLVIHAKKCARQGRGMGAVIQSEDGRVLKGYGQLTLWSRCAEISDLVVAEPFRRQGLGTALIQYLVRAARERRAPYVEIAAAQSNTGAVELYRRLGFEDHHTCMLNLGDGLEPVLFLNLYFDQLD